MFYVLAGLPRTSERDPRKAYSYHGRQAGHPHQNVTGDDIRFFVSRLKDIRANHSIIRLQAIDWNAPSTSEPVNVYMGEIVKETMLLHKVLYRYLPQSIVEVRLRCVPMSLVFLCQFAVLLVTISSYRPHARSHERQSEGGISCRSSHHLHRCLPWICKDGSC